MFFCEEKLSIKWSPFTLQKMHDIKNHECIFFPKPYKKNQKWKFVVLQVKVLQKYIANK